jgi:DNA-binding NarL/FixJ family response regulator
MKRTRVLLADDHKIRVNGLRGRLESRFKLAGTVGDRRTWLPFAPDLHPDMMVVDISMPWLNGNAPLRVT